MDRIERLTTDLQLDAIKQTGIKVVKVTDRQVRQFVSNDEYRDRAITQVKQALGKFSSWVGRHVLNIRQAHSISSCTP